MALAYVQSNAGNIVSTDLDVAFSSDNTAGNLIIAAVTYGDTSETMSVSDTQGNSYLTALGPVTGSNSRLYIFYVANCNGGANTVTFNPTGGSIPIHGHILEYSGHDTSSPLDQTSSDTGTSTTPDSGSQTTTVANEIIFGFVAGEANPNGIGPGATFTEREDTNRAASEDKIVSSTGSYSADFTFVNNVAWIAAMATFKEASATTAVKDVIQSGIIPFSR